jgi:peptidyl-tRNA hydrolase, PTH1 family
MLVDALAQQYAGVQPLVWRTKFHALIAEITLETQNGAKRLLLIKPQTYMNESGRAVQEILSFIRAS